MRAERPMPAFYRFLYGEVGRQWRWVDRLALDDAALSAIVQDPSIEVHVLWADGQPAGFAELDRRKAPEGELAYFGLMPAFLGRGLGWFLLNWAVDAAWLGGAERVWVRTTSLDHPRAIVNYQRAGFVPVRQERFTIRAPTA
jgi:GNAT superfamily N-acetyltransferase